MTWSYNGTPVTTLPEDCVGFVYLITNRTTQRKYIGKKLSRFTTTRLKTVILKNGKKKKKKIRQQTDSDWQTYWGSNDLLLADVQELGEDQFTREILQLCASRGECSYWENYYIFQSHALLSPDYYNQWTSCKVHRSHLKHLTTRFRSGTLQAITV